MSIDSILSHQWTTSACLGLRAQIVQDEPYPVRETVCAGRGRDVARAGECSTRGKARLSIGRSGERIVTEGILKHDFVGELQPVRTHQSHLQQLPVVRRGMPRSPRTLKGSAWRGSQTSSSTRRQARLATRSHNVVLPSSMLWRLTCAPPHRGGEVFKCRPVGHREQTLWRVGVEVLIYAAHKLRLHTGYSSSRCL